MIKIKVNSANKAPSQLYVGEQATTVSDILLVSSKSAIVGLYFIKNASARKAQIKRIKNSWPNSDFVEQSDYPLQFFDNWRQHKNIELAVSGTRFQQSVWRALLKIPAGQTRSYGQIAAQIDRPKAARAVGTAVGSNPITWIIPCHRVIRGNGEIGQYHWGSALKRKLLEIEGYV